jgi:hypothetical protein
MISTQLAKSVDDRTGRKASYDVLLSRIDHGGAASHTPLPAPR